MRLPEDPKIDCHCHVLDPVHFPYNPAVAYHPTGQEIGTPTQMEALFDTHNVVHALLVQPNSGYGGDNSCMMSAIAANPRRYKGVAVVANDISLDDLAQLKAQGIVGVAFNLTVNGIDYYRATDSLLAKLNELDLFLQLQFEKDQLLAIMPLLDRHRNRLLIDHCGRPTLEWGVEHPAFQTLLALGRDGRAHVKLSGFSKFSRHRHPYSDALPFVEALIDAYTIDRCLWASDWPYLRAPERLDFGPFVDLAHDMVPDPADRAKFMWDNAYALFGFGG